MVTYHLDFSGICCVIAAISSSAKNYKDVTVVVDPADYDIVLKEMEESGGGNVSLVEISFGQKGLSAHP